MLVAQSKYERGFIVDCNGRTAFLVIVAALPILQVAPLLIPKETKAIDDQQFAATSNEGNQVMGRGTESYVLILLIY